MLSTNPQTNCFFHVYSFFTTTIDVTIQGVSPDSIQISWEGVLVLIHASPLWLRQWCRSSAYDSNRVIRQPGLSLNQLCLYPSVLWNECWPNEGIESMCASTRELFLVELYVWRGDWVEPFEWVLLPCVWVIWSQSKHSCFQQSLLWLALHCICHEETVKDGLLPIRVVFNQ